ncbi:MAG: hypothetical protein ACK5TG_17015, partial [Planctomyces sp.]
QRATLERLAADLMEMETMSAEHMHRVIEENRRGPKLMAVPPASLEVTIEDRPAEDAATASEGDSDRGVQAV